MMVLSVEFLLLSIYIVVFNFPKFSILVHIDQVLLPILSVCKYYYSLIQQRDGHLMPCS